MPMMVGMMVRMVVVVVMMMSSIGVHRFPAQIIGNWSYTSVSTSMSTVNETGSRFSTATLIDHRSAAINRALSQRETLLISLASDLHIFQKPRQLFQEQGLRAIDQRLMRCGVEVRHDHIGPGDNGLCGHMH